MTWPQKVPPVSVNLATMQQHVSLGISNLLLALSSSSSISSVFSVSSFSVSPVSSSPSSVSLESCPPPSLHLNGTLLQLSESTSASAYIFQVGQIGVFRCMSGCMRWVGIWGTYLWFWSNWLWTESSGEATQYFWDILNNRFHRWQNWKPGLSWKTIIPKTSRLGLHCALIIEILQSLNENSSSEPLQRFHQRRIGIGWKLAFICSPLLLPMQLDYVHLVQTSNDFQVKANIEFGFIKWKSKNLSERKPWSYASSKLCWPTQWVFAIYQTTLQCRIYTVDTFKSY